MPYQQAVNATSIGALRATTQQRAIRDFQKVGEVNPYALVLATRQVEREFRAPYAETSGPVLYELAFASSDDPSDLLAVYAFYEWFVARTSAVAFLMVAEQWIVAVRDRKTVRLADDANRKEAILTATVSTLTEPACQSHLAFIERPLRGAAGVTAFRQCPSSHPTYRLLESMRTINPEV